MVTLSKNFTLTEFTKSQTALRMGIDNTPVMIIGSENMPAIPLNSVLEQTMIPSTEKVQEKIIEILNY